MSGRILRQIGHTAGFKLGVFGVRFLLLYLLAQAFTPADYGAYALVTTTASFGVFLLGLNLYAYVYREAPGRDRETSLRIFKSTFVFEVLVSGALIAAVVFSGALDPLLRSLKAAEYRAEFVAGLLLLLAMIASAEVQHYLWARAQIEHGNVLDFISQALWVLPLFLLWAAGWELDLRSVLLANLAGVLLGVAYGLSRIEFRAWLRVRPSWGVVRTGLAYSVPMIVPALSFYALKLADRYVLSFHWTLHEVGLYSFAYSFFNTLYAFTATVILNAILPYVVQAHNRGDMAERNRLLATASKASLGGFAVAAALFLVFSEPVLGILARSEYLDSRSVMPLLAVGYVMIIVGYPAHYLLMLANRTTTIMWIDLVGLVVGVGGLFLLVPRWSYHGAAVATIVGFAVVAALKHLLSRSWESLDHRVLFSIAPEVRAFGKLLRNAGGAA